jgi:hypothetical protein
MAGVTLLVAAYGIGCVALGFSVGLVVALQRIAWRVTAPPA